MARPVKFSARRPVKAAGAPSRPTFGAGPKIRAAGDIFDYAGSKLPSRGSNGGTPGGS